MQALPQMGPAAVPPGFIANTEGQVHRLAWLANTPSCWLALALKFLARWLDGQVRRVLLSCAISVECNEFHKLASRPAVGRALTLQFGCSLRCTAFSHA